MSIMKKILAYIAASAAALLSLCGCGKTDKPLDITGEWNLNRIETKSAILGDQTVDVYVSFKSDNTFDMYQMLGTGRYRAFSGTWTLVDKTLSGKYSDGSAWGSRYEVSKDDNVLTLTTETEIDTYTRKNIPESVIASAE